MRFVKCPVRQSPIKNVTQRYIDADYVYKADLMIEDDGYFVDLYFVKNERSPEIFKFKTEQEAQNFIDEIIKA